MYLKHRKNTRWSHLCPASSPVGSWSGRSTWISGSLVHCHSKSSACVRDFATSALNSNITSASLPAWQLSKPLWLLFLTLTLLHQGHFPPVLSQVHHISLWRRSSAESLIRFLVSPSTTHILSDLSVHRNKSREFLDTTFFQLLNHSTQSTNQGQTCKLHFTFYSLLWKKMPKQKKKKSVIIKENSVATMVFNDVKGFFAFS